MNISGKYLKVWKKTEQNGFTKLNLGDSKKDKEGKYQNWTWFGCTLFGNAKQVQVEENDVVEVKSGIISQRKYNDKWYNDIIVFEIEVMQKGEKPMFKEEQPTRPTPAEVKADFEDDIPY